MSINETSRQMRNKGWTSQAVIGGRYSKGNGAARRSLLMGTRTYKEFEAGNPPPVFEEKGSYHARLIYTDFEGKPINNNIRVNPQQGVVLHTHQDGTKTVAYLQDYRPSDIVPIEVVDANVPPSDTNDHPEEVDQPETLVEGSVKQVLVNRYERDQNARDKCIKHYGAVCTVCSFDFAVTYGDLGKGFIHVHHLIPLSTIGHEYQVNPLQDLRPVCPNCHAMLHRGSKLISVEELRTVLRHQMSEK